MEFEWSQLVQLLGFVISFIITQGGIVSLINRLKLKLGTSGRWTTLLVVGVVAVWTIINMIVQGLVTPAANAVATFIFVLERTQTEYMRLHNAA
jgi:hypothetical protein